MNWPVGMGGKFEGLYELEHHRLMRRAKDDVGLFAGDVEQLSDLGDERLEGLISAEGLATLRDEAELAQPLPLHPHLEGHGPAA